MNDSINDDGKCGYVRIEPAQELFDNPPEGWFLMDENELLFEYGNPEDVMWRIRLSAGDDSCPYVAEHTLYDIQHDKRIDEWREKEQKRMSLVEDRMKRHEEEANAKADFK